MYQAQRPWMGGARTYLGVYARGWTSSSNDKSLTRSQDSCGKVQERWRSLPGSAKSRVNSVLSVFILLGRWTLWTWTVWCHDSTKAKVLHKYGQAGGSKGRRGMGKGWGDTKEEDSSPWRRVPLKVQIRTLLLDEIVVFPCSECRWSSSYNLPEPHYPSPTGFLLLRGGVQNQWGVHGLSELTSRSWQGVLIS